MVRRRKASSDTKVDGETKQPLARKMDDYDSSDEEDLRNTIGNIPVTWYDDLPHFGYDKDGKAIAKAMNKDQVEAFLEKMDDPDYWKKVFDQQSGGYVTLSDEQVAQLEAMTTQRYADVGYNPYQPFVDLFSSQTEIHPISNRPDSKQAFIPSLDEKRMVGRMVHAIKMGWARPKRPPPEAPKVYDLWAEEDSASKTKNEQARIRMHFPAPKVSLPGHVESYNPPQEYLLSASQYEEWLAAEPEDRRLNFVPQKFDSLRNVPAYEKFFNERYERCLDLYLAPRQQRMKLNVDYKDLLPELPNPADVRPFPTTLAYYLRGHEGHVRSVSFEPTLGELLVSGGADGTIRVWAMTAGYCVKTIDMKGAVNSVAMCPIPERTLVAAVIEPNKVMVLNTGCGDKLDNSKTQDYLKNLDIDGDGDIDGLDNGSEGKDKKDKKDSKSAPIWSRNKKTQAITIELPHSARRVVWHAKGDYFATFAPTKAPNAVYIHQLSTGKSMAPFAKSKGTITDVAFHPREPLLFVASLRHIRIYDLAKCILKKKLMSGSRSISNIKTDNLGENLFVAGLDRNFTWLDLQLSTKPWKSVKHHTEAIRALTYHQRYPLMATVSDDGSAIVYYAKVSVDSFKENEFFPVRRLKAHTKQKDGLCMLDTVFHPTQPWLVTAGADGLIALFTY